MRTERTAGFDYLLCGDAANPDRCIYYLGLPQEEAGTRKLTEGLPCPVVYIAITEWDDQLTPWPAKGLYVSDSDFKGEAPQTLARLVNEFIPQFEAARGWTIAHRSIAGYSLAGLFAVYAFANCSVFESVASMSGSFWYEGWVDYLASLHPDKQGCFAYLSLGDKERKAKEKILHSVQDNTDATAAIMKSWGAQVESTLVPGGHFDHIYERVSAGLVALVATHD